MEIASGLRLFIDTNILLYAVSEHPTYGNWCERLLDRIRRGDVKGELSVVILNELVHKLVLGEVAQNEGIRLFQAVRYIKQHPEVLEDLDAYEVVEEVERGYGLTLVEVTGDDFSLARTFMKAYHLLSNDALHLAIMKRRGIVELATSDPDFYGVEWIRVWKPESL